MLFEGKSTWIIILVLIGLHCDKGLAELLSLTQGTNQCIRNPRISVIDSIVDISLDQGVAHYKVEYQSDIESFIDVEVTLSVLGFQVAPKQKFDPCTFNDDAAMLSQALCPVQPSDNTRLEGELFFDPSIIPCNVHELLKSDFKIKFVAFESRKHRGKHENDVWIPPWKRVISKREKLACFVIYSNNNDSPSQDEGGIGKVLKHFIPGWRL